MHRTSRHPDDLPVESGQIEDVEHKHVREGLRKRHRVSREVGEVLSEAGHKQLGNTRTAALAAVIGPHNVHHGDVP